MTFRPALIALAAAAPSLAAAAPAAVESEWVGARPAPRGDALLRAVMLARHNAARAAALVGPLAWDDALAADALAYARSLASRERFEHDPQAGTRVREGENLWMGTRGAYTYGEMAATWSDERRAFRPGRFPDVSSTGNWRDVGHYTQMIWAGTTRIGCALAAGRSDDYVVCRYAPAGNVIGAAIGR